MTFKNLILALGLVASSGFAATQEELDSLRSQLVKSYNTVSQMSVEQFSREANKLLIQAQKDNNPLLAERVEAALELNLRDSVLKISKDRINEISNNGLFLIGVAVCQALAAHNGGWCYNTQGGPGYISPAAFVILTLATLGETESGSEF
jgi:hypothetical protein